MLPYCCFCSVLGMFYNSFLVSRLLAGCLQAAGILDEVGGLDKVQNSRFLNDTRLTFYCLY